MTDRSNLIPCSLTINGRRIDAEVPPGETLLEMLRERLGLRGTRKNCEQGECGACTVLLDGQAINSCLILAASVDGHEVTTIEGLQRDGELDPIQEAFAAANASQCGFCTSGMIMASRALLTGTPNPDRDEVSTALEGNYCRCTGYQAILEAVAAGSSTPAADSSRHSRNHVTGETLYLDDMRFPGMLYGVLVHTPVGRALIREVDSGHAMEVPGVVRVFTAADFSDSGVPRFGPLVADQPILADDVTRYQGEPVAMVVGESEQAARAGAAAVRVVYEELPAIVTRDQALSGDLIHEPASRPEAQQRWTDSNVMAEWVFDLGDPEELDHLGASAALVVENTYEAPFTHHFFMEPYGTICIPDGNTIRVLTPVQHPFVLRRVLAMTLGLAEDDVRVEATDSGGGFGGKGYAKIEPVTAACSRLLGRPLKVTQTAEESFLTGQREASHIRVRTGFSAEGDITFQEIDADFLIGAYTDISPAVVSKTALYGGAPYRVPCARIRGRGLFTTTAPTTAFRGFGASHMNMAVEGQMNVAAHRLGIDPIALRLRNMRKHGEEIVPGDTPVDSDWPGLLGRLAVEAEWGAPRRDGVGRGVAFGMKANAAATSSTARVHLGPDGNAIAYVGTTEMGQGQRDGMRIIVGEALGLPRESVTVIMGDTGVVPFDSWTASSRSTVFMGNALQGACGDIKRQLAAFARSHFSAAAGDVLMSQGTVALGSDSVPLRQLLRAYSPDGVTGEGTFAAPRDPGHPLGGPSAFYEVVATAVELHIDRETGQVVLDTVTHGTDAGTLINRDLALRQDEGGIVMGQSLTLSEQLVYDTSGTLANGSSLDYRIATIGDLAGSTAGFFQENGDGPGPNGARGLGEGGILAIGPAICGAILDLTGLHLTRIPITPERLWGALSGQREPVDLEGSLP
ncbi:molybdopterin-dependent oxidoreductase [bacterium]|nr:molybdopterin-dependent oxidoreductase [bacterium]